jgi:hypothetical protein
MRQLAVQLNPWESRRLRQLRDRATWSAEEVGAITEQHAETMIGMLMGRKDAAFTAVLRSTQAAFGRGATERLEWYCRRSERTERTR